MMQQSDETARRIQYLRDIIQSGKMLKLLDPKARQSGLLLCAADSSV